MLVSSMYKMSQAAGLMGLGLGAAVGDAAIIVTMTGPSTVLPGQPVNVLVQMKNVGTTIWDSVSGYKLGDGNGGPYRAGMVPGEVKPGETASFQATFIAPNVSGTYNANYQMLQEGVNWFGPIANLSYQVVPIPPIATPIIVSPSDPAVTAAANLTTASGDTSSTSQATLNANVTSSLSFSNLLSGSMVIGGYTIPTVVLIGGAVAAFWFMSSGHRR